VKTEGGELKNILRQIINLPGIHTTATHLL
jgi:hypothetical protein